MLIFGRCNDCKFAGSVGLGVISCSCPKMPKTHKNIARSASTRNKTLLDGRTHKCEKYEPSGKQIFFLSEGLG